MYKFETMNPYFYLQKACTSKGFAQNANMQKLLYLLESQTTTCNDSLYESLNNGYHFFVGDDGHQVTFDDCNERWIVSSCWISKDDLVNHTHHINEGYFSYADTSLSEIGDDPLRIFEALSYDGYCWEDMCQTFDDIGDLFAMIFGYGQLSQLSKAIDRNFL